ncbi:hypothetical protein [Pseudarthrobacter equi]|uniref:hypothetical protein n=1 Tax=Pseudarthrobacter equi TaxID=728066 RepID=UPI0028D87D74|nr:hypothetical protein [Pseudarthrobacter equi]
MTLADDLRRWAKGMYGIEAATELLLRAFDGKFATPGNPWIHTSVEVVGPGAVNAWIDFESIPDHSGALSGGERKFLLLAASLATDVPVVLGDVVTGLDRQNVELLLAAIAHAAGSHEHSGMTFHDDGTPKAFTHLTTLYRWP